MVQFEEFQTKKKMEPQHTYIQYDLSSGWANSKCLFFI